MTYQPLQVLLLFFSGSVNRRHLDIIDRENEMNRTVLGKKPIDILLALLAFLSTGIAINGLAHGAGLNTFQNGLYQGQDPFVFQKDGFYYLSQSGPYGPTALYVSKSRSLANQGEKIKVYQAHGNLGRIFAPEIFYIDGQWYIYACADVTELGGRHHAVVFQGTSQDPQDPFVYKGVLYTGSSGTNYQANDFTVFQVGTELYASWGTMDEYAHGPAIAKMDSPLLITQDRSLLPSRGGEGPRVLQRNGKTFITASMAGWATKGYHLGMYINTDGNLLNTSSWTFRDNLFNTTSEVWGPGRAGFVKSADGSEDWMIYHSKIWSTDDNGWRQVNIQKFTWNADGTPNFGTPASPFAQQALPSGDPGIGDVYQAENAELAGGAGINTNNAGYTGTGFVDSYYSEGANTTFTVNVPQAGDYLVTLRYSNGIFVAGEQEGFPPIEPPLANTVSVYVNGVKIRQTSLDKTTDWSHWMLRTERLTLSAGNNRISYRMDSGDIGLICLDYIAVTPSVSFKYADIVPTSEAAAQSWKYTTSAPASNWNTAYFNDAGWNSGSGGFGTVGTPGAIVRTAWDTSDIWLRRTFNPGNLTAEQIDNLQFRVHHDEEAELYINGVLAATTSGYTHDYAYVPLTPAGRNALVVNGNNVLAVHVRQKSGGQYIDAGISVKVPTGTAGPVTGQ